MTRWTPMSRRKERMRSREASRRSEDEEKEAKLTEPRKTSENIQHSQEIEKPESTKTFKPNIILAQIPRYAYLLVIFALLAGVFFPLITPGISYDYTIQGTATLFLGLAGGMLLFKAITSDNRRGILIAISFALIAICLALIYYLQELFKSHYY